MTARAGKGQGFGTYDSSDQRFRLMVFRQQGWEGHTW